MIDIYYIYNNYNWNEFINNNIIFYYIQQFKEKNFIMYYKENGLLKIKYNYYYYYGNISVNIHHYQI